MSEVCVDFLELYSKFFDRFSLSVDPNDQLPVKVAGYNLIEPEIVGAVGDWALQYLESRKCPPFLTAHLVRKVVEEVRTLSKIDPISCGYRAEVGDFLSLKLMQACIGKVIEVCARYRDNAELSSLPPPHALPPVTTCAVKNSRRSMEDRHVVIHDFHALFNIKGHGSASYYGVFDGHNGSDAAVYSVSHLHQYLAESAHYPSQPALALREACIKTDDYFSIKAQRENLHGGTTAVFALLRPRDHKLYVAWLGDSQAVLVRQGLPLQIVRPHKPDRSDERDRIEGMGGTVLFWGAWRVNGQLAVSRAIGDVEYKPYVTAEPDMEEITLDGTEDFLILACDGLWDFVTEQQATNAVYKQLQENSEDLESVSQRLVALAKEQSSQDNISVVVVFLADPAEVAKRRLMETASPNPFVSQNGSELFCGGTNGQLRPPATAFTDDDEDFGPETDVDMVDDVLLSPAIAAAKALVSGKDLDDLERQRQQLSDFDDPADIDRSRDTPTPPAHEVAGNANAEVLAESGGEESEEEWNYIPGTDTKPDTQTDAHQEQDDMSSQLNPNAAEFVPVSPTRLLLLDDAIITASPRLSFEKPMDNIQMPSEMDFCSEISHRAGDLDMKNGPKHEDGYFMRDNFSTLRNKVKDFNVSSTCAELGNVELSPKSESLDGHLVKNTPFDKLEAVQNITENTDLCKNIFGATNFSGDSDPMTTSFICQSTSSELETPKSTTVEAPISPVSENEPSTNNQVNLDATDELMEAQQSAECTPPVDELTSGQKSISSTGFDSETDEGESNVESNEGFITEHRRSPPIDLSFKPIQTFSDTNPFGALQTPSATTPLDQFSILAETIVDPFKTNVDHAEPQLVTPTKSEEIGHENNVVPSANTDFLQSTPTSFISLRRSPASENPVPFNELESPTEVLTFEHPPNANSSILEAELPKSPEPQDSSNEMLSADMGKSDFQNYRDNVNNITQDLFSTEKGDDHSSESCENLDTTEGFLIEESKILQDEQECEQLSKQFEDLEIKSLDSSLIAKNEADNEININTVEPVVSPLENFINDAEFKGELESEEDQEIKPFDYELETKEMKLEFESHIADTNITPEETKDLEFESHLADTNITPEETKDLDEEFEVISKEELGEQVIDIIPDLTVVNKSIVPEEHINTLSTITESNPFACSIDSKDFEDNQKPDETKESEVKKEFIAAIESLSMLDDEFTMSDQSNLLSSPLEPQATRTVSYQTLTPADEPKICKTDTYVTGVEEILSINGVNAGCNEIKTEEISVVEEDLVLEPPSAGETSDDLEVAKEKLILEEEASVITAQTIKTESAPVINEPVLNKSETVQSQVVTETLITALEETSQVPPVTTVEVQSKADTLPLTPTPTPVPPQDMAQQSDLMAAAVAAAGAVAVAAAVVSEKDVKKDAPKKPAATSTSAKKPVDAAKASTKPGVTKAAAAKPAITKSATTTSTKPATTATTKPAATALKPGVKGTTSAAKPASATTKPTVTTAKPTATTVSKPGSTKTTAAPTAAKKPAAAAKPETAGSKLAPSVATRAVPNKLSVTKSSSVSLKPSSKPSTPTNNKPTTPTTPRSPSVKSDIVKSPARLGLKSPRAASTNETSEKKPLTNGEVKPLVKKSTTSTVKPVATFKSIAPVAKTAGTVKGPSTTTNKAAASTITMTHKTTSAPTKPKPAPTTTTKPGVPAAKRPTTAPLAKAAEKSGKEAANKMVTTTKPAVNGKTVPSKTTAAGKKTDPKVNGKNPSGKQPPPIKKPENVKIVDENCAQVQEDNVTTTNGFAEHIEENGILKIEEMSPVILEGVN